MSNPFMTVSDAALTLGMTREGVRALERRGHLIAERTVGGWRLFRAHDVLTLRAARLKRSNNRQRIGAMQ